MLRGRHSVKHSYYLLHRPFKKTKEKTKSDIPPHFVYLVDDVRTNFIVSFRINALNEHFVIF